MKKILVILLTLIMIVGCQTKEQTIQENIEENKENIITELPSYTQLKINNNHIVDENNKEFIIKGISTHGLQWYPQYIDKETFRTLKEDFGINTIRLAMYTAEGGYCETEDKEKLELLIDNGIKYTKELNMYVIIDWHILSDNNPMKYVEESKTFFSQISKKYKDEKHIIYEICNEPNGSTTWKDIKEYADIIIPEIRKNTNNIIIVGTPTWSQEIDKPAKDPLTYNNVVYALHYYAATHKSNLRYRLEENAKKIPIIVSEFGICDASGNGYIDEDSADKWIELLDKYKIGRVIWNLSNKDESSSILKSDCSKISDFTLEDLSKSGLWLMKQNKVIESQNSKDNYTLFNGLNLDVEANESWESDNDFYQKYSISITNHNESIDDWKIVLTFNQKIDIDQYWNCDYNIEDKTLILTPKDYNSTIQKGNVLKDIGLIIKSDKNLKIENKKIQ